MSSRNGRRHRKKVEEDSDVRLASSRKEDPIRMKHAEPPVICLISDIAETDKCEMKKPATPIHIASDIIIPPTPITDSVEVGNGNGYQQDVAEIPLVDADPIQCEPDLDTEEQELQKLTDDGSDIDSHKGSPVLTDRCATRRSQTRNIPTPKTPKVNEQNEDEKEHIELTVEYNGCTTEKPDDCEIKEQQTTHLEVEYDMPPLSDVPDIPHVVTAPGEEHFSAPSDIKESESNDMNQLNVSKESCESAVSTQVNVGGDITREIDLTLPEENSFLNTAKDLNVVETLRRMSSRRAIRPYTTDYRKTLLKSQAEKLDLVLQQQRVSTERVTATKRKTRSTTPDNAKRFKAESSPGFFSYITSPLSLFRNRFGSSDAMSASTPKLTGYREQEAMEEPELSKIEDSQAPVEKKRCIIM